MILVAITKAVSHLVFGLFALTVQVEVDNHVRYVDSVCADVEMGTKEANKCDELKMIDDESDAVEQAGGAR